MAKILPITLEAFFSNLNVVDSRQTDVTTALIEFTVQEFPYADQMIFTLQTGLDQPLYQRIVEQCIFRKEFLVISYLASTELKLDIVHPIYVFFFFVSLKPKFKSAEISYTIDIL